MNPEFIAKALNYHFCGSPESFMIVPFFDLIFSSQVASVSVQHLFCKIGVFALDVIIFHIHGDAAFARWPFDSRSTARWIRILKIKALRTRFQLSKRVQNEEVPMAEEALAMISQSFRQVVLDVKVGPPSFEKGLAEDILSLVSSVSGEQIARIVLSGQKVGYVVMVDKFTNRRTELVRIEGAKVAGIYHPLIHEKVMKVMRRHDRRVFAWTVDDSSSMKKMLYEHVDAIVTSNPSLLQQLMQETRAECMEDGFALP
ncbi:Glycerophosphodiester phosphodiesterase GDPD4 [Zea mays]|uniref:glycerophosphodiester phosphodiesterase n=1 Tax=Zea mays TaxID=4577 RepID=A0A1D6PRB4_MAIZE|nr:Glycerophosphodiester phosphodiesterase GDPD4 [Zea mays]